MQEPPYRKTLSDYRPPKLVTLDAVTLSAAIRDKRVSCTEVMAAYLDHIDVVNPLINAIVSLRDRSVLMSQANARDLELARGEYRGWMHGFPQAIKDLTLTADIPTTFGSPLFRDYMPNIDAIVVERAKRDGAIIIGKTNTPEHGLGSQTYNPVFGATRNAYDRTKTAGGSSGGAAAALAMKMLPVADGSDMMGSLRNPAAYNNVIGFRPSLGRVPHYDGPVTDVFMPPLSTEGPMGRTVADVARLLATQAGHDARVPLSLERNPGCFADSLDRDFTDVRLGWLGDWGGHLPMEQGVMDLCEDALVTFGDIGCTVEWALPDFGPERLWEAWLTLRHATLASGLLGQIYKDPARRAQLKPEAQWEVEGGLAFSITDVSRASVTRSQWHQSLLRLFDLYDFLLLPTAQVFPFDVETHWPKSINGVAMDTYHRWMEVVVPGSLSACPVISVPAGFNVDGLPMGMQIIGRNQADLAVLQLAYAYEQARDPSKDPLPTAIETG